MRSIAMRKRKQVVNWAAIFATTLAVNVVVASYKSPLTAVRNINLSGVRPSERLRLDRVREVVKGVPAMQLDPATVEQFFMGQSRVKHCMFSRNIFGGARLDMTYRKAVATVGNGALLDVDGEFFSDPEQGKDIVQLNLAPSLKVTSATLMGVTDFRRIAEACAIVAEKLPKASVEVLETGTVRLDLEGGKVVLGKPDNLPEKIDTLLGLLRDRPTLLKSVRELNLMAPDNPTVRPIKPAKTDDKPVQPNP